VENHVGAVNMNDSKALIANFDGGLLLTRGAIDLEHRVPNVTLIPAALFAWVLDHHG
jgi:hypothetical protein